MVSEDIVRFNKKLTKEYFFSNSYSVVIADIDRDAGLKFEKKIGSLNLKFIPTDVSKESDVINLVKETINSFGHLNCLINNASITSPYLKKTLEETSFEEWNNYINTNLNSVFFCSKHCIPFLKQQEKSSIVNISSTRALMSEKNTEGYSASKGAVLSLTHSMAISLNGSVYVNSISPGWIDVSQFQNQHSNFVPSKKDHEQHPSGRVGHPKDIAELCNFLITQNGFINGQNFICDGGMTKKMIYDE